MGGVRPSVLLSERPTELAFYLARYDAGIYAADRQIADLLAGLRKLGVLENSLLAVVGDHGEALGGHGYFFGHGRLPYDDVLRVPLLLRLPGGRRGGTRVAHPVAAFSLAPTLLELARLRVPAGMEARSLLASRAKDEPVFSEAGYQPDFQIAVRLGTWKLIWVQDPLDRVLMRGSEWELYDLAADPQELHDLHALQPQRADRYRRRLLSWVRSWRPKLTPPGVPVLPADPAVREGLRSLGYLD
jgi:arylsulfatase A-like enzyme